MKTASDTRILMLMPLASWRRWFHIVYDFLIRPYSKDEDAARKEFIVNIILFSTICFLTILEFFLVYQYFIPNAIKADFSPYFFSFIYFIFIGLYILSRKGYFQISAYLLVLLYLYANTYAAWHWGPDLYQVVVSYALIITIAGIVINSKSSFVTAIFISIAIILGDYLNIRGFILFDQGWKDEALVINDTVEIALTFLMISFISWLSNREIDRSLKRAHRSERALKEKNESLEQTVEDRTKELRRVQSEKVAQLYRFAEFGRLSSGIFHDLINPLSIITLNVNQLEASNPSYLPDIKKNLDRAVSATKRMDRFLQVVRKQIQTTEFRKVFCINDEIEEVLLLLNYSSAKQNIVLEFQAIEKVDTYGNPLKFQQIITNLISNAIDSYEELVIAAKNKIIRIDLQSKNDEVRIKINDNGCGVSKEVIAKIFDPFFTTKSEHKGIGLGLSTTKEAVEKDFNGTIDVSSEEGEGSTFVITFPLVKSE